MPPVVSQRRWFGTDQPQTLQIAVGLLYWNAALSLIFGLFAGGFGRLALILLVGDVIGAFGVANERKWGYYVALGVSLLPLAMLIAGIALIGGVLNLLFQIALVALLLHPMSRRYFQSYFR